MANDKLSVYLPPAAMKRAREIADDRGIGISDAVRLALGLLDVAERARERGEYMGTTPIREHLQTVMVTPL